MKEDVLTAMVRENAFCRVEIEWYHRFEEVGIKPYWYIYFVSANCKDIRYPLVTARGGIRAFKTLDTVYSAVLKICGNRIADIRIIPEPW